MPIPRPEEESAAYEEQELEDEAKALPIVQRILKQAKKMGVAELDPRVRRKVMEELGSLLVPEKEEDEYESEAED